MLARSLFRGEDDNHIMYKNIMLYLYADGITKGHNPTSTTPKPQKEKNTQKNKPPEDA